MIMTQSLLTEEAPADQLDPSKKYYEEYVGDGKPFKDPEALAKAKFHSDTHIKVLEKKLDEMREDYVRLHDESIARAKLEDLIKDLETKQQLTSSEQPSAKEVIEKPMSPDQIKSILSEELPKHINAYEQQTRADANFNKVRDVLTSQFGSSYPNIIKDKINSLGLTAEDADALARKSPTAFFNTLGLDMNKKPDQYQAPPRSSNTFAPRTTEKKTYSYYQNLRKTNPKLYHDSKTNVEMDRMAQELGEEFFDVDV
jgi:hypothetical protein